jgi:aspartate carbamoyltransferase catalytic subunit
MNAPLVEQRRDDGTLCHLVTLENLDRPTLERLLDRAQQLVRDPGKPAFRSNALRGITVANLFGEPSTRTRTSFELAATRLGADVVNLEVHLSSRTKGETVLDTVYTLQAMQLDVLVLREAEASVPGFVAQHVAPHVSILSAGEANLSHPTQGLLDALTVRQRKGDFARLKIAIVGDIEHSRVARSAWHAFSILGAGEVRIVAPHAFMPRPGEFRGCARFESIDEGIRGTDVIMMLRIQKERMADANVPDVLDYFEQFGLSAARLRLAAREAIVMHPGPMNRGVEIDSAVADGPHSVILPQVTNGVAVRMAVLEEVTGRAPRGRAKGTTPAGRRRRRATMRGR